ncbi:hypothetical protein RhiJN_09069 [Ceratobasidium sp. AG-Ba]|nr:hypothetical protein RhiJN_09069 [Ceratobasidium sp. AG-Ba]
MPAADSTDQQAARAIEASLRDAVNRLERPPVELEWFAALPKRVRRSGQLVEAAFVEAKVLLDHIRADWTRARRIEQEREDRLAKARAQPRDIDCLRAPDPTAWHGLGRRKKRCRAFESVGRAYNTRQQASERAPAPSTAILDVQALESPGFDVPTCPSTPPSLRVSVRNIPGLLERANGPADGRDYGWPSPPEPSLPSTPSSTRSEVSLPAYPSSLTAQELTVRGVQMDRNMAYIVARGRHSRRPCDYYTVQEAAVDMYFAEARVPGLLEHLARVLFPGGLGQYDRMCDADGLEAVLDFVQGWYQVSLTGGVGL